MPAMENNPMFFKHITAVFLLRTCPASSIQNPAAINITKNPHTQNKNVFRMYATSPETAGAASTAASCANNPVDEAIVTTNKAK